MPTKAERYPADWKKVSHFVRFERAKGQCECTGECGLHNGQDLFFPDAKRCSERHGEPAQWARGKVILTTAHLNAKGGPCQCDPLCSNPDHLKAMCNRCHLRYDAERHATARFMNGFNQLPKPKKQRLLSKLGIARKRRRST